MSEMLEQLLDCEKLQSVDDIVAELKSTLPWLWHPQFHVGPIEGYDGSTHMFGARAGFPEHLRTYNVLHEVSHAVEMTLLPDDVWHERILQDNFDMDILSYQDIMGQRIYEPQTMQATKRECRVGGIQLHLLEAGGYDTSEFVMNFVLTLKYTKDSHFGGSSPDNVYDPTKYTERHKKWIALRTKLVMESYKAFTLDDIKDRWQKVMNRFQY